MITIPIIANDRASELITGMLIILKYQPNALPDLDTYQVLLYLAILMRR